MNILDSSLIIDFLREGEISQSVVKQLVDERIAISSFTVHEILVGANKKEKFVFASLLESIDIYSYDYEAAVISSKIEKTLQERGTSIGITDIYIAAIALKNDATVVTLDSDFKKVPGLKVKCFSA